MQLVFPKEASVGFTVEEWNEVIADSRNCISFNRQGSVLLAPASLVETRITMSETSLTDILNELRSERTACEEILNEMQALKDGEFQEIFANAALESYRQTSSEITDMLNETASTSVSASAAVSSRLQESISLLEEQAARFKRIQRRCTAFTVISWGLLLGCFWF